MNVIHSLVNIVPFFVYMFFFWVYFVPFILCEENSDMHLKLLSIYPIRGGGGLSKRLRGNIGCEDEKSSLGQQYNIAEEPDFILYSSHNSPCRFTKTEAKVHAEQKASVMVYLFGIGFKYW